MTVSKPSWLRSWLDKLNFDIFTWKVYIGDAIERAIDWALGWINWGISQANLAWNNAVAAWNKAVEVSKELTTLINKSISKVYDKIDTWWDDLKEWWEGKRDLIRDWIDEAEQWLLDRIDDVKRGLASLTTSWDNFRRYTLPNLIDLTWWTSFWGGKFATITDWWGIKKQEISDTIDVVVKPVRDEVNKHLDTLEKVKQLLSDPLDWKDHFARWVMNTLESILARLW